MTTIAAMFDWDGVLMDSLGASFNVYNKIFAEIGARQLTMDEFLVSQSPNWYEFYRRIGLPQNHWREVDREWLRLYEEEEPALHQDALRCLSSLKESGFRLALVSNGSRDRVTEELTRFNVLPFFDSTEYGVGREHLKPSPFMLEKTLALLGIGPAEAVYVGDSPADIQAAKSARVPSVALARGPIQRKRLIAEDPDKIYDDLDEFTDALIRERNSKG